MNSNFLISVSAVRPGAKKTASDKTESTRPMMLDDSSIMKPHLTEGAKFLVGGKVGKIAKVELLEKGRTGKTKIIVTFKVEAKTLKAKIVELIESKKVKNYAVRTLKFNATIEMQNSTISKVFYIEPKNSGKEEESPKETDSKVKPKPSSSEVTDKKAQIKELASQIKELKTTIAQANKKLSPLQKAYNKLVPPKPLPRLTK